MSYIGQRPVVGRYIKLDQISSGFNGSETSFSMTAGSQAVFPGTARNLLLSLGGVIQEPDTNFTISGSTLTFTTAPVANTTFFAVIFGDMQSTGTPSDGTVLPASIASSGNFSFPQLTVTGTSSLGDDVTFTGANYNVVWDKSDNALEFADNAKAMFGTGSDLNIYHDGSHSYIQEDGTGHLKILGSTIQLGKSDNSELGLTFTGDGSIQLRYDNSTKFETTSSGVTVTGALATTSLSATGGITGTGGNFILGDSSGTSDDRIKLGAGGDLHVYHDGTDTYVSNATGDLRLFSVGGSADDVTIRAQDDIQLQPDNGDNGVNIIGNGAVELYHDNSKKFETTSTGAHVLGTFEGDNFKVSNPGNNAVLIQNPANGIIGFGANNQTNQVIITTDGHLGIPVDNKELRFGASDDLKIYHSGSNSFIKHVGTGDFFISCDNEAQIVLRPKLNEAALVCKPNGAVELYYDNIEKFETHIAGEYGSFQALNGNNGWDGMAVAASKFVFMGSSSDEAVGIWNDLDNEWMVKCVRNAETQLQYNGSKKFETKSDGVQITDTNPLLHIQGTGTSGDTALFLDANANHWIVRADNSTSANLFSIKSGTPASSTHRLVIDSSGNVGIGTTNPNGESINGSQNLVIMDTTSDGGMNIKTGTSGNAQIHFSDTSGNGQGRVVYAHATDTLKLFSSGTSNLEIQNNTFDFFNNRNVYQRFHNIAIADGANKFFTISGLGYGWAKIQLAGYGEGHSFNVEVTVGGLMASGGTYYRNTVIANSSSSDVDVNFGINQTTYVITISNNVGNGGSIHATALFTGSGQSSHPSCAVT